MRRGRSLFKQFLGVECMQLHRYFSPLRGQAGMTLLALVSLLLLFAGVASAQVTPLIDFQGKLQLLSGTPVNGSTSIQFQIFNVSTGGSALWNETQNVNVQNGSFNALLGGITPLLGLSFNQRLFLEVNVSGDVLSPRLNFTHAPFAVSLGGLVNVNGSEVEIGKPNSKAFVDIGGGLPVSVYDSNTFGTNNVSLVWGSGGTFLAMSAACFASGAQDRFLVWRPGSTTTCAQACATIACGSAASCAIGWTFFGNPANAAHYRYGNECTVADPSGGQGISGKACCCTGTGCGQGMYR